MKNISNEDDTQLLSESDENIKIVTKTVYAIGDDGRPVKIDAYRALELRGMGIIGDVYDDYESCNSACADQPLYHKHTDTQSEKG